MKVLQSVVCCLVLAVVAVSAVPNCIDEQAWRDEQNLQCIASPQNTLAAVTVHASSGIEGHKFVRIAPQTAKTVDGKLLACDEFNYVQCLLDGTAEDCRAAPDSDFDLFCQSGCVPFERHALNVRRLKACFVNERHLSLQDIAWKDAQEKNEFKKWVQRHFTDDSVESIARNAYKKLHTKVGSKYSRMSDEDYAASTLIKGVSGALVEIMRKLGDDRSSGLGIVNSREDLANAVDRAQGSWESNPNLFRPKYIALEYVLKLSDRFATCFSPEIWDSLVCAPTLWPLVGFFSGLGFRTDGFTTMDSHGRLGTHYYGHAACMRAAVGKLLAYQEATWTQPGWWTSLTKRTDTVNPSPKMSYSCQAFTNGFKSVLSSPRTYLPQMCQNVRMSAVKRDSSEANGDMEELLRALEQNLEQL